MTAGTLASLLAVPVLALAGCAGTDAAGAPASTAATATTAGSSAPASAPAAQRIEVTVRAGEVSGDTGRVAVPLGNEVTLAVTSDVADQVHVHGYDLSAPLTPGTAELTFDATLPGVFEVELHEAGTVLLTLQVG